MKLSKLLLAVASAVVLSAVLAGSAGARTFSLSHQNLRATWTRMDYSGGFGTVECEITVEGSAHTRTIAKVVNLLLGYVTSATVHRCARGGATILAASLPWHVTYKGFAGTLPNITGANTTIIGAAWAIREPFGATCLVRSEASSLIGTWDINARVIESIALSGSSPCRGAFIEVTGTMSGTTSSVSSREGARITITLI
jgi:hypothetical protein